MNGEKADIGIIISSKAHIYIGTSAVRAHYIGLHYGTYLIREVILMSSGSANAVLCRKSRVNGQEHNCHSGYCPSTCHHDLVWFSSY
jgi:hypothetical protein